MTMVGSGSPASCRRGLRTGRLKRVAAASVVAALLGVTAAVGGSQRWYGPAHAAAGAPVYDRYCSGCHARDGSGAPGWRQQDAEGYYLAPPLNGSGHAWHHPLRQLYAMIRDGSQPGQGRMPALGDQLSPGEILAVIARFQSWWPDDIYDAWERMEKASAER